MLADTQRASSRQNSPAYEYHTIFVDGEKRSVPTQPNDFWRAIQWAKDHPEEAKRLHKLKAVSPNNNPLEPRKNHTETTARIELNRLGAVIPLNENKTPFHKVWKGIKFSDSEIVDAPLIGIIPSSLDLICFDLDKPKHVKNSRKLVQSLSKFHLYPTVAIPSRSGAHVYYNCTETVANSRHKFCGELISANYVAVYDSKLFLQEYLNNRSSMADIPLSIVKDTIASNRLTLIDAKAIDKTLDQVKDKSKSKHKTTTFKLLQNNLATWTLSKKHKAENKFALIYSETGRNHDIFMTLAKVIGFFISQQCHLILCFQLPSLANFCKQVNHCGTFGLPISGN